MGDTLKRQVNMWVQLLGFATALIAIGKLYSEHNINSAEIAALRAKVTVMSEQLVRIDEKIQLLLSRK